MVVKKSKTKKITIDNLAQMVARGFENTANKEDLKNLEKKMDQRFEGVEGKIEGINNRIDDIYLNRVRYEDHEALKRRVKALEKA